MMLPVRADPSLATDGVVVMSGGPDVLFTGKLTAFSRNALFARSHDSDCQECASIPDEDIASA